MASATGRPRSPPCSRSGSRTRPGSPSDSTSDRDGHVSLSEWEQAREEAKRTVAERQLDRPAQPALNVLSRPDGGQLFLIAAFPEGDIAKRYRRRAVIAFVGFAAAVYALGWLLQGVFGGAGG